MKVNTYILKTMIRFLMLFNHLLRFQSKTLKYLWSLEGELFNFKLGKHDLAPRQEKHHTVTLPPLSAQDPPQPQAISQCNATRFRHPSGQCGLLGYCLSLVPGRILPFVDLKQGCWLLQYLPFNKYIEKAHKLLRKLLQIDHKLDQTWA